jgi:hypothetical protein
MHGFAPTTRLGKTFKTIMAKVLRAHFCCYCFHNGQILSILLFFRMSFEKSSSCPRHGIAETLASLTSVASWSLSHEGSTTATFFSTALLCYLHSSFTAVGDLKIEQPSFSMIQLH